jgi:ribose transport system ATP-binding protein
MISSEMPELLRMSDRIVVMNEGYKTGEVLIQDATQEGIMEYATKRSH